MTDDLHSPRLNPWHPMTDPVEVKIMGKLGEEAGELTSACCRCIIQGIDEVEPTTNKLNRRWLEEEIADVMVGIEFAMEHFGLDLNFIGERVERKRPRLKDWHGMA